VRCVTRSVVVAAPPEEVFALLADIRRHPEIDGSGTVRGALRGPERLTLGSRFGMKMRLGIPYVITSEVIEFTEGRRIAWRHFGHHVWRYELEPVGTGTKITESFDWRPSRAPRVLELIGYPARNTRGIEATLKRFVERFGAG
jgi:hypothetical protein